MKLVEVKVLERANAEYSDGTERLDSMTNHPRRWRYMSCWENQEGSISMPVGQGDWHFDDGYCSNFLTIGEAWIVGEIEKERQCDADRFEPADEYQTWPSLPMKPEDEQGFDRFIAEEKKKRRPNYAFIKKFEQDRAIARTLKSVEVAQRR